MKKIFLLCLTLFACDEETRKQWNPTPQESAQGIRYVKDNRTGLCFVYNNIGMSAQGGGGDVYTNVPCTPEVEKLIK